MQTENKVLMMVAELLNKDISEISLDTKIKEDLQADSLDLAELLMNFEEEFDFLADEASFGKIITIGDAVKYIESTK